MEETGRNKEKDLRLADGVLKKQHKDDIHGLKELLVIAKGMRARLVSMAHDYCGHVGTDKVTWTLRQNYTLPGHVGTDKVTWTLRQNYTLPGHVGTDKVTWTLRQNYTLPGMYKQIKTYCQPCDSCQKARRENERKIPMGEMPLHSKPFENVAVHLVGPSPRTKEVLLDIFRRASQGRLFTGRGRCGKSHILSCACMYYCILCHLLRMYSFTYIMYSRLCL